MADAKLMDVVYTSQQLLQMLTRCSFFELLVLDDKLE